MDGITIGAGLEARFDKDGRPLLVVYRSREEKELGLPKGGDVELELKETYRFVEHAMEDTTQKLEYITGERRMEGINWLAQLKKYKGLLEEAIKAEQEGGLKRARFEDVGF